MTTENTGRALLGLFANLYNARKNPEGFKFDLYISADTAGREMFSHYRCKDKREARKIAAAECAKPWNF